MTPFKSLWEAAVARKGGNAKVEIELPTPLPLDALMATPDSTWLSDMGRRVFSAGFNQKVVAAKWPAFEEAFEGFDPGHCAMIDDERLDRLASDPGLIRHGAKMRSVRENAAFLVALREETGEAAAHTFARWPHHDFVGLIELLKKRGSRLGGLTGQYLMRGRGVDGFALSPDVVTALIREGVVDAPPTSKKAMMAVQTAFDIWHAESGRPLMQISKLLALTVDTPPPHN